MNVTRSVLIVALLLLGTGAAPVRAAAQSPRTQATGTFGISAGPGPYISGSLVPLSISGITEPFALCVLGIGSIENTIFTAPLVREPSSTTIVGAAQAAIGLATIAVVPPPSADRRLIAVASYDNGVALHDPNTFAIVGYAGTGDAPGDVAFGRDGTIFAPSTTGSTLYSFTRDPWRMNETPNVPLGNEVAIDRQTGDIFVSNRDIGGRGALTKVTRSGDVSRIDTGETAEGLAIDEHRQIVYVGNVNDATVLAVDARSMKPLLRIKTGPRPFGIALDEKEQRLFVVSNASTAPGGYVAAFDLGKSATQPAVRSRQFVFPLGAVYDSAHQRVFVTDEAANLVYVLNARTLSPTHSPLTTCATPWRPSIDPERGRLYIPCARANRIAVYDLRTLQPLRGSPFITGGFPLSVAP
ncbi:MAG: hypothetical protein ABI182_02205 [Candidatus Baltobacteraceae bacterium]